MRQSFADRPALNQISRGTVASDGGLLLHADDRMDAVPRLVADNDWYIALTFRSALRPAQNWIWHPKPMARVTGLEPATSGVTGRHSNQLSYTRTLEEWV